MLQKCYFTIYEPNEDPRSVSFTMPNIVTENISNTIFNLDGSVLTNYTSVFEDFSNDISNKCTYNTNDNISNEAMKELNTNTKKKKKRGKLIEKIRELRAKRRLKRKNKKTSQGNLNNNSFKKFKQYNPPKNTKSSDKLILTKWNNSKQDFKKIQASEVCNEPRFQWKKKEKYYLNSEKFVRPLDKPVLIKWKSKNFNEDIINSNKLTVNSEKLPFASAIEHTKPANWKSKKSCEDINSNTVNSEKLPSALAIEHTKPALINRKMKQFSKDINSDTVNNKKLPSAPAIEHSTPAFIKWKLKNSNEDSKKLSFASIIERSNPINKSINSGVDFIPINKTKLNFSPLKFGTQNNGRMRYFNYS